LPSGDLCDRFIDRDTTFILFQGRRVYTNSIFCDGFIKGPLIQQIDVWSKDLFFLALYQKIYSFWHYKVKIQDRSNDLIIAFEGYQKVGGYLYFLLDITYHRCPRNHDLNGNYQFGLGLEYRRPQSADFLFEIRYLHISNGGSEKPNEPLNSVKCLFGVTF